MKPKVFIDGKSGTTGLLIEEKLYNRSDIDLILLPEEEKKNIQKKSEIVNQCNLVILCLPDLAAKETVSLVQNPNTKIIDASTAHRIHPDWVYGFAEMSSSQRKSIQKARYVSNPGCYALGTISLLRPLKKRGIFTNEHCLSIYALSGYSGGGKKLMEEYEKKNPPTQAYALKQMHKHLPEITKYSLLQDEPHFIPLVGNFAQGMLVQIPFFQNLATKNSQKINWQEIYSCYKDYYRNETFISVAEINDETLLQDGFLTPCLCNHTNQLKIAIYGNKERFSLVAILDNLGKGASSSAVQNLNIMLGFEESLSLI